MSTKKNSRSLQVRIIHRYLGFFLAGIMAVYAVSGIVLIFRKTNTFKNEIAIKEQLKPNLTESELGSELHIKGFKIEKTEGDLLIFKEGNYNHKTGFADYKKMELPFFLEKMQHLHKATTKSPLFYLNIFFGLSLLFFVLSAFWMYTPKTSIFKKGIYFTAAGIVLTLVLLFI